jgi:hypothetical protein
MSTKLLISNRGQEAEMRTVPHGVISRGPRPHPRGRPHQLERKAGLY